MGSSMACNSQVPANCIWTCNTRVVLLIRGARCFLHCHNFIFPKYPNKEVAQNKIHGRRELLRRGKKQQTRKKEIMGGQGHVHQSKRFSPPVCNFSTLAHTSAFLCPTSPSQAHTNAKAHTGTIHHKLGNIIRRREIDNEVRQEK